MRAIIVVLGDIGRSPRMVYHALALADRGVEVDVVGYVDTVPDGVADNPRITLHPLPSGVSASGRGVRWLVLAGLRGVRLSFALLWTLLRRVRRGDVVLVQNPPGVPTLIVARIAAWLRGARLVVDWHNLTASMLALRLGAGHWLVRLVARYEGVMGRMADGNLFVSQAMADHLRSRWRVHGTVFRDRPAERFTRLTPEERQAFRRELFTRAGVDADPAGAALVVSPSSWSADDDFDLLLDAADECDRLVAQDSPGRNGFPPVLILVTGRGPRRQEYEARIASRQAVRVHLRAAWLEAGEYPRALACADVGLSLHRSASGLDLPMKAVDLFGAGVPVLALDYGPCLSELVRDGVNGRLFATSGELARLLLDVFGGFPDNRRVLDGLRQRVEAQATVRWGEAWREEAAPVVVSG